MFSSAFNQHHLRVQRALDVVRSNTPDSYFAQCFLDTLASKNGNDILEAVLVEATGRSVKALTKKHGADSADGLLESKPMKTKYAAHISDDTPASLLRHHTIPYIIIGEASPNGQVIQWAISMSYRAFDQSRYSVMRNRLSLPDQALFSPVLPLESAARYALLRKLKEQWPPKNYIRSNPLPLQDIAALKAGEFTLWVNPDVDLAVINKEVVKLKTAYPDSILTADYMAPFLGMREYNLQQP